MTTTQSVAALMAKLAYMEGDFTLTSGKKSTFYLDAKKVTYHPDGAKLVGQAVLDILREFNAEALGGLTMGADAIVASTVVASAGTSTPITGFVVRKEPKGHGTGNWIEGVHPKGKRVAIVDDVITSGKSVLIAVEKAREAGAEVVVVVGVVDREEGGGEAVRAKTGVECRAVCTLTEIKSHVRR